MIRGSRKFPEADSEIVAAARANQPPVAANSADTSFSALLFGNWDGIDLEHYVADPLSAPPAATAAPALQRLRVRTPEPDDEDFDVSALSRCGVTCTLFLIYLQLYASGYGV